MPNLRWTAGKTIGIMTAIVSKPREALTQLKEPRESESVQSVSAGKKPKPYGTRKDTVTRELPLGVTTWTSPLVAPTGTGVVISELDTTVKVAAVPLELTLLAPVRLLPRRLIAARVLS